MLENSYELLNENLLFFCQVRCWEVQQSGQTVPKAQQTHTGPVLDVCWNDVSSENEHQIELDIKATLPHDMG